MPVVLGGGAARRWLTEGGIDEPPELTRVAVSTRINRTDNDDPGCLSPLAQGAFRFD